MSFPIAINLDWEEMTSTSVTQKYPLGTVGRMLDGRSFRYAKNGGAVLRVGSIVVAKAPLASAAGGTSGPLAIESGTTQTSTWRTLQLETTFTTLDAKDFYKDGWLWISSTGHYTICGQQLQIKSSKAHTASSTLLELTLYDNQRLLHTLTSSDAGPCVSLNPYDSVIVDAQGTAALTGAVVGIPPIGVAISYYFWLQTWGLAAIESGTAAAAFGSGVVSSTDAANTGIDDIYATTGIGGYQSIGVLVTGSVAGGYALVDLRINP